MENFKKEILALIEDLPEKDMDLIVDDWKFLLLLPRLNSIVQKKLFDVFDKETLASLEKKKGLDFAYFVEEVLKNIEAQQVWIASSAHLSDSKYLIEKSKKQLSTTKSKLTRTNNNLSKLLPIFQQLKNKVAELEEKVSELENLKTTEHQLATRKEELEKFQQWIKDQKLEELAQEVKHLNEKYRPFEQERDELENQKEKMIQEKSRLEFEVDRLKKIKTTLKGSKPILTEYIKAIQSYNEEVMTGMKDELEVLQIHQSENEHIAEELNDSDNIMDLISTIKEQLERVDIELAQQIEENTDRLYEY